MKVRVVSLKHREDRRKKFEEANGKFLEGMEWSYFYAVDGSKLDYDKLRLLGFDTDKNWRDPLLKRTLTYGEIGCFLSHYRLWEEASDTDEVILVLEDDAILSDKPSIEWAHGDLTYLAHKEMMPEGVVENLVCYPYWTAAYIITPPAACQLLETNIDQNIIPVDEFLPRMTDRINMVSFDKARQATRAESGSDVEPTKHSTYVKDFEFHNLTCHNSNEKAAKLIETNKDVVNILDRPWRGGTMEGPGGGQKLNALREYVEQIPDHDIVMFTDGFDVFFIRPPDEVLGRFLEMKAEIVFAAEKYLWPDKSLLFPPTPTPYRYLNSGCLIGRAGEIKRILSKPILDHEDDQLYLHHQFLTGRFDAVLDVDQYLFMTNTPNIMVRNDLLLNTETRTFGCVYHGNGGEDAKERFEDMYNKAYPEKKFVNLTVDDYTVIGNEMLLVDFLTPSQCEEWIRIGDENGSWAPHYADKFPSHDIHLKELGLWTETEAWWNHIAAPVFEKYWSPTKNYHLRKAFLMRYSTDTQKTLGLHNDASMVTGSVKLNNNYEGATLIFPRQNVTNRDIPIGKMILFPGSVTHGHYVDELTEGTKYSLTLWSARFKGDLLNPE